MQSNLDLRMIAGDYREFNISIFDAIGQKPFDLSGCQLLFYTPSNIITKSSVYSDQIIFTNATQGLALMYFYSSDTESFTKNTRFKWNLKLILPNTDYVSIAKGIFLINIP